MTQGKEIKKQEEFNLNALFHEQGIDVLNSEFKQEDYFPPAVTPQLQQIVINHQAGKAQLPNNEQFVDEFRGILVCPPKQINAYWEKSFDETGGGEPPDCSSFDGHKPDKAISHPFNDSCLTCKNNQFQVDENGNSIGKPCKNMMRFFILLDGDYLPTMLTITPGNLKNVAKYNTELLTGKLKHLEIVTGFKIEKTKNSTGITFAKITFKNLGKLQDFYGDDMEILNEKVKILIDVIKSGIVEKMQRKEITADEFGTGVDDFDPLEKSDRDPY